MTRVAAHEAQLLVHDASFADEEAERAARDRATRPPARRRSSPPRRGSTCSRSSTSRRDTTYARCSTRRLEAFPRTIAPRDFDVVEIPFPERGEPRHVEGGARQTREPRAADPSLAQ